MSEILNITRHPVSDERISKREFHNYAPFLNALANTDEIRISVQHQDLILLPSESFLYIEGAITDDKGAKLNGAQLNNNCMAFLFEEIRYELNGVEIDRTRNVGVTSTLKNYISLNDKESQMLCNAGWSPDSPIKLENFFNFCVPLKMLLGFAEDYTNIIVNARHELVLIRTRTDNNAVNIKDKFMIQLHKVLWRVPHINVSDEVRLSLLKVINTGKLIQVPFRSWELYEHPTLPTNTKDHVWTVKTSTQLEKPRFIIFALQTDKNDDQTKDNTTFDHCNLTDIKAHLNSETYPYNDLNIMFDRNRYALLYQMYANFRKSYYDRRPEPLINLIKYKDTVPIVVIDCLHQNETIKTGVVDIKIEFKTSKNIPEKTIAYCLLLHDRIIEYNPLTNEVRKQI